MVLEDLATKIDALAMGVTYPSAENFAALRNGDLVWSSMLKAVLKVSNSTTFYDGTATRIMYVLKDINNVTYQYSDVGLMNQNMIEQTYVDNNTRTYDANAIITSMLDISRISVTPIRVGNASTLSFVVTCNGCHLLQSTIDYGDGSAVKCIMNSATATSVNVSDTYTYTKAGFYRIIVNIYDDKNHEMTRVLLAEAK